MPSTLEALYNRAPVTIWVEDAVTRAYLQALWSTAPFQFLIGGNKEGVKAAAQQAEQDQSAARSAGAANATLHVYGIADRDYERTNLPKWPDPLWTGRTFYLDAIEIENLLLDEAVLASIAENFNRRSPAHILEKMHDEATRRLWWSACKQFLAEYSLKRKADFPPDPKLSKVSSLPTATQAILGSTWFSQIAQELAAETASAHVSSELARIHNTLAASLDDGTWKSAFPGKELFETTHSDVTNGGATKTDVAAAIGREHAAQPPAQLVELRKAIARRTGL